MANRRNFLKALGMGMGMVAVSIPGLSNTIATKKSKFSFHLGVASFTLRKFSQERALDMTLRCGVNHITFKNMHLPLDSDKAVIKRTVDLCKEKGIYLYGAGVIKMMTKEEADQAFEYAKTAELDMIVGVPAPDLLDYVENKVKTYDIKLAIHNHGPGDDLYPSAKSINKYIGTRDKRMGICLDIGHTRRINRNPVRDFKEYFERIHDVHIKDVTAASTEGKTCIIGRGIIDFKSFMKTVKESCYTGTLALEYEAEADDPLPGMMESLGYVKGIIAML